MRAEHRDQWRELIRSARRRNPDLRILSISGGAERRLPGLVRAGLIERDPELRKYYGSSAENLRRMLVYVETKYLGGSRKIEPPEEVLRAGMYHPDRDELLRDADEFLHWSRARGFDVEKSPRAVVAVHYTHLALQQPLVVDALIREFEKRGVLVAAVVDAGPEYERILLGLEPDVVIHTCHSRDRVAFREKLGALHLQCIFFRKQSIADWRVSLEGLASNESNFQIVSQELLGQIEPQVGSGTKIGGGSSEAFTPIPGRIAHLVDRALAWIRLRTTENRSKKVAFVYWDREMGKAELMRGSATGMFLNGPRSLVRVLERMKRAGYDLDPVPADEDELVSWMMERGRQIGIWAPEVLDRLAKSGEAVLVPVDTYREWFEAKVPEQQRKELVQRWGEPPGRFLVWKRDGEEFIVIPRIALGNV
ncbi:MAG: cobaltochelatase subunit CobN, partial [Planctomycetota bacterium]